MTVLWGNLTESRRMRRTGRPGPGTFRLAEDEAVQQIKVFAQVNKDYRLKRLS